MGLYEVGKMRRDGQSAKSAGGRADKEMWESGDVTRRTSG